jgi:hypothetical protein
VKNTNSPDGDPFPNEVKVDLHVLGALMLHGVGGEVDGAHIVTIDKASRGERLMQLL